MLVITYHLDDTERVHARRLAIRANVITIGRDATVCNVVVQDDPEVAATHVLVQVQPAGYIVTPHAPVLRNNQPITGPTTCAHDDTLQIGRTIVKLRPESVVAVGTPEPVVMGPPANPPYPQFPMLPVNPPRPMVAPVEATLPDKVVNPQRIWRKELAKDPDEHRFLASLRVNPGDEGSRMVYADWLEQRGRLVHAQVVRGDESADRDVVVAETDPEWRAIASCRPIADCTGETCPRRWSALVAVAHDERVRRCKPCGRTIRYCLHVLDPRGAERRDEGLVLDSALTTYPHDTLDTLDEPPTRR